MIIREPRSAEDFEKYFYLRWQVLRQPWGQPQGSERDSDEDQSIHAMVLNELGEVTGVCRLHESSPQTGKIRFMAVKESEQGKGIGNQLLSFMERKAREAGMTRIVLEARENAVQFYLNNHYKLLEKTHLLFGSIQHYRMEKSL
jgi:N-acetylglutamate synthase-like GNAT family acetyltransferase